MVGCPMSGVSWFTRRCSGWLAGRLLDYGKESLGVGAVVLPSF